VQREGGSGFASSPIPEEPSLTLRAVELWIAADEAAFRVKHFSDAASTELDLASLALFDQLALWQAVYDWDEFAHLAGGALASVAAFQGLETPRQPYLRNHVPMKLRIWNFVEIREEIKCLVDMWNLHRSASQLDLSNLCSYACLISGVTFTPRCSIGNPRLTIRIIC
jgi:hypothetical protein